MSKLILKSTLTVFFAILIDAAFADLLQLLLERLRQHTVYISKLSILWLPWLLILISFLRSIINW